MRTRQRLLVLAAIGLAVVCAGVQAGAQQRSSAAPRAAVWTGDLTPIGPADWNYDRAAHLLERAGFGGTPEEIRRLAAMTPEAAVNYLVDYELVNNDHLLPFEHTRDKEGRKLFNGILKGPFHIDFFFNIEYALAHGESLGAPVDYSNPEFRNQEIATRGWFMSSASRMEMDRGIQWWANRMLLTRRPLEEKMVLFWHGHFAAQEQKLHDYEKMLIQMEMFRRHATGNFRNLLVGIAQDPAMIRYLDNNENIVGHANENLAREIMELFAMGEGRGYTEADVREAARALTGWSFHPINEHEFVFRPEWHDFGQKTIFGQTGYFNGEDLVDLILRKQETASFIAPKIYRYFVRADRELPPGLEGKLAAVLRDAKYELKPLLKTIFLSRDFHSATGTEIKPPIHLVVSTYKRLGLQEVPGAPSFKYTAQALGQEPFNPPNVAGWVGGRAWINPATLLERANFARRVFFPEPEPNMNSSSFNFHYRCGRRPRGEPRWCYDTTGISPELLARLKPSEIRGNWPPPRPAGAKPVRDPDEEEDAYEVELGLPVDLLTDAGARAADPKKQLAKEGWLQSLASPAGQGRARDLVPSIPLTIAKIDLVAMLRDAKLTKVDEAVDYLITRFMRAPLNKERRQVVADALTRGIGSATIDYGRPNLEASLREALHVLLSMSEYQLY